MVVSEFKRWHAMHGHFLMVKRWHVGLAVDVANCNLFPAWLGRVVSCCRNRLSKFIGFRDVLRWLREISKTLKRFLKHRCFSLCDHFPIFSTIFFGGLTWERLRDGPMARSKRPCVHWLWRPAILLAMTAAGHGVSPPNFDTFGKGWRFHDGDRVFFLTLGGPTRANFGLCFQLVFKKTIAFKPFEMCAIFEATARDTTPKQNAWLAARLPPLTAMPSSLTFWSLRTLFLEEILRGSEGNRCQACFFAA